MNYAVRPNVNPQMPLDVYVDLKQFFRKTIGFEASMPRLTLQRTMDFSCETTVLPRHSTCSQKETAMSFTRPMNVFLVCAAFAFVASVTFGFVP